MEFFVNVNIRSRKYGKFHLYYRSCLFSIEFENGKFSFCEMNG